MSKFLKDHISKQYSGRLDGVEELLLVNVVGLNSESTMALRKKLREKGISLLVIKNSLMRRACEGTSLANAFEGIGGSNAVVWGAEDFVTLSKEIIALAREPMFEKVTPQGGVLGGEQLTPERVKQVSKWPNRQQQLGILAGQILAPGAKLSAQLIGPAGKLASQVKEKGKGGEGGDEAAAEPAAV